MGTFFLAYSASSFIAAKIAQSTVSAPEEEMVANLDVEKAVFAQVYTQLGIMAFGIAIFLYCISPILGRAMYDENIGHPTFIAKVYAKSFR